MKSGVSKEGVNSGPSAKSLQCFTLVGSAYVPLAAYMAAIRIVEAVSVRSLVGLIGSNLRLFLTGVWNFAGSAKEIAKASMPKSAHQAEMSAWKSVAHS